MVPQSLSNTVYQTVIALAEQNNGEIDCQAVSHALKAKTFLQHKRITKTLSDLYRTGKLQRLRLGVYAPVALPKSPDIREAMWRVLRMRKRVTVEDMMTMAGAGKAYAYEWLAMLTSREVVRMIQQPGNTTVWILINDRFEMPANEEKAAKLRDIRARKKVELSNRIEGIEKELKKVKETIAEL